MLLKLPPTKRILGYATLALALSSSAAFAGPPDRTATELWGPSSQVWLGESAPMASESTTPATDPVPNAAPRTTVSGAHLGGNENEQAWGHGPHGPGCEGGSHHHDKALMAAHEQAKSANAPLHARLKALHEEIKTIWTAPTFDREAFLNKRAEMRDIQGKIQQNIDTAFATAAAQLPASERAAIGACWHHEGHHGWHKKHHGHHGWHKKHHRHHGHHVKHVAKQAAAKPQPAVAPADAAVPAK